MPPPPSRIGLKTILVTSEMYDSTLLLLRTGIGNVIISSLEYDKNAFQRLKTILVTFDGYNSTCLLYTSPSPRDPKTSRMPSSA